MSTVPPIQDMPPKGGFASILYHRVPTKKFWNGRKAFGLLAFVHLPILMYRQWVLIPNKQKRDFEHRGCAAVITPFLKAERDRQKMIRARENIEIEAELMKDVPGWEVGTWFGEPIYKTVPADEWEDPINFEYYVHTDGEDWHAYEGLKDCVLSF